MDGIDSTDDAHGSRASRTRQETALDRDGTPVEFGPFQYDPTAALLSRDGVELHLPPRAVAVLELLLEKSGDLVTKDEIFRAVWGKTHVTEDAITQAISLIRQALGEDPQDPDYIQTVPRRGYRFIAPVALAPVSSVGTDSSQLEGRRFRRFLPLSLGTWALSLGIAVAGLALLAVVFDPLDLQETSRPGDGMGTPEAGRAPDEPAAPPSAADLRDARTFFERGARLHGEGDYSQAVVMFEEALRLDPNFALAHVRMAGALMNLRRYDEADRHRRRAFALRETLSAAERAYLESLMADDIDSFLERSHKTLALDECDYGANHNLSSHYIIAEDFEKARDHLLKLQDCGRELALITRLNLAAVYADGEGDFDKGKEILVQATRSAPRNPEAHLNLALYLVRWGHFDEASEHLDRAEWLGLSNLLLASLTRAEMQILRGEYASALETAASLRNSARDLNDDIGRILEAYVWAYRGQTREAAIQLWETGGDAPEDNQATGVARFQSNKIAIRTGDPELVVERMERRGPESWDRSDLDLLAYAWALARAGRAEELEAAIDLLSLRSTYPDGPVTRRKIHFVRGELELHHGDDPTGAVDQLGRAARLVPPHCFSAAGPYCRVVAQIWFSLGEALVRAERPEKAREWFEKVIGSFAEREGSPIVFVRSLYHLGRLHADAGEAETARDYYQRFLDHWEYADVDQDRVNEAKLYVES